MVFNQIVLSTGHRLFYVYQNLFSVHDFGVVHRMPYRVNSISPLALTRRMMKNVNKKYPSTETMQSFRQHHYGLGWNADTDLVNQALFTTFSATAIRGDWLNNITLDKVMICHVMDSLYLPSFNHPELLEKDTAFDEEKSFNLYRLKQLQVNSGEKIFKHLKVMFPHDSHYAADLRGDEIGMTAFTKMDLKPFYERWIRYPIDFYYVGHLPVRQIVKWIEGYPYLKQIEEKVTLKSMTMHHGPFESKTVQENHSQSHLVQIYTTEIPRLSRDSFAIRLLNSILGEGSESLLFQDLREKHQFCYAVSTGFSVNDGLYEIRLGLHQKNIAKAKEIIAGHIKDIQEGRLNDEAFSIAKQEMLDGIIRQKDTVDYRYLIMNNSLIHGIPYDEDRPYRMYESLTIEDMVRVAKLLRPHRELIYLGKET